MNLYYANKEYCSYLHLVENRVSIIEGKKERRPFLGLLICVGGKNYFAPLTSPKKKHLKMNDSKDFIRIDKGNLGAINLNNMIPIPKSCYKKIEIDNIKDEKYGHLLKLQGYWCDYNTNKINKIARQLYEEAKTKTLNKQILDRCCNFELLEKRCFEFMNLNHIREEEVIYEFK